jgi:hypothetical protein
MSEQRLDPMIVTRAYWARFMKRAAEDAPVSEYRRENQRHTFENEGAVIVDWAGDETRCRFKILEISQDGVTGRVEEELPVRARVQFEFSPEGKPLLLKGRIVHCTQTVGGFKVGITLTLPEDG